MLISYKWIQEFVDVTATPQEAADRLSMAGLEIEGVQSLGEGLDHVVVATILETRKHPNADKLILCQVRTGDQIHSIVCGAKNMKPGDKVALALPGAQLAGGLKIQKSKIRGEESHGMLCSETELELASQSEGILILPKGIEEGSLLADALDLKDTIFEVNVTPNRGDCLSVIGLARELAANFKTKIKMPHVSTQVAVAPKDFPIQVRDVDLEGCPRYCCQVIRGVRIGPSPSFVRRRLEASGLRSINNVVDATNYVMLETGHPMHAFDLKQIRGAQLKIRRATRGEKLATLDGILRDLIEHDLVIADQERVLALAGIMGGEDSGIGEDTADLLLECAFFDPSTVRRTAKRLGLQTDSSYRFERGVDPNGCDRAIARLADLIVQIACGEVDKGLLDIYPSRIDAREIYLRIQTIQRVIGLLIPDDQIVAPLEALGLSVKNKDAHGFLFSIPTYRSDLTREIDLVEEVARLYGYNNIPDSYPSFSMDQMPPYKEDRSARLRQLLVDGGYSEIIHYSFSSPSLLKLFGYQSSQMLQLLNPISEDLSQLRPALLPQMIETLKKNIFNGSKDLKLFELRKVYRPITSDSKDTSFHEELHLALGLSGRRRHVHFLEKKEDVGLLDLKGYLNNFCRPIFMQPLKFNASSKRYFHPSRQATLSILRHGQEQVLGEAGELHPSLLEELGLSLPLVVAEINLDLVLTESKNLVQFQDVSSFPSIWRDLSLLVDEEVGHADLVALIEKHGGAWIKKVELFDLYRGQGLPEGKKALTYSIEYATCERTLMDGEVNQASEKLLKKLNQEIGASLREG